MGFIKNLKKYLPKEDKKLKAIKVRVKEHEQEEYYKAKEKYEMSEASKRAKARATQPNSSGFSALLSSFAPPKTSKGRVGKPVDLNAALFGGGILGGSGKGKKYRGINPRDII